MALPFLKIGTCGLSLAKSDCYKLFSVVEVQQTFYQPPTLKTALHWRGEAPLAFEFSVKAWQLITHEPTSPTYRRLAQPIPSNQRSLYGSFRPTDEVSEAWAVTDEIMQALRARVVLFQSPSRFHFTEVNETNLRSFFRRMNRRDYLLVWEVRGDWPEQKIEDICRELDLVHGVDPFQTRQLCGAIRYFRLHGKGDRRYRYTDQDLAWLKDQIDPEVITYLMFNNSSMVQDAQRLKRFIYE